MYFPSFHKIFQILGLFVFVSLQCKAQYTVTTGGTATEIINELVGPGVEIISSSLSCDTSAYGMFSGTGDLGIDSGIVLTSGTANTLFSPFSAWGNPTQINGTAGDSDLDILITGTTLDACILQFEFIPTGDSISFNYVFGSSEYGGFSCSSFNDAFAFFITGPGITGTQNLAVIPGTSIPVAVNSTTGIAPWVSTAPLCNAMGPGSPFSMYYVDNTAGAFIAYGGFTTKFVAQSAVNPCAVYTLKLTIADATDNVLDSGVFLEAGSLSSNTITTTAFGGGGFSYPNSVVVRGCNPGQFTINRTGSTAIPATLTYILEGSAINGIDYETLPGTITIPSGESSAIIPINPIVLPTLVGMKTVVAKIINPFSCADTIVSDTIFIYDSLFVDVNLEDTIICLGASVNLSVNTAPHVSLSWSPTTDLVFAPDIYNIVCSPTTSTIYTASVNIEGSGCADRSDNVNILVTSPTYLILEDSLTICAGDSAFAYPIYDSSIAEPSFTWTPSSGVSDTTIANPALFPNTSQNYILTVGTGIVGCEISDSVFVTVNSDNTTIVNDTVCFASFPYIWNGKIVKGSGENVASVSFPSSNACDSFVILNVFITTPSDGIPCCSVFLPNAFSPNGDGINDNFGAVVDGFPKEFKLEIYNRWGERVFASYKPEVQWNGNYGKDKPAEAGVYFYLLRSICSDGTQSIKKGDLTLVR